MDPFLFIFFLLHLVQPGSSTTIIVDTSNYLERLLCDHELHSNEVHLILNTNITHRISSGKFCTVNISHSFTITSSSSDTLAHIICVSNNKTQYDKYWTRGFAFHGSRGLLTFSGLKFSYCGTNLTTLHKILFNHTSSSIHFTQYHAAVLVFTDIASITVHNVSIVDYNGFAILAINLPNASFNSLLVTHSQIYEVAALPRVGSGVLILFYDRLTKEYSRHSVSIISSIFQKNFAFDQYCKISCKTAFPNNFNLSSPVMIAAGVTILYMQQNIPATVSIFNTNFFLCHGCSAGAMLIICSHCMLNSKTIINDSYFHENSLIRKCPGSAIRSFFVFNKSYFTITLYQPLILVNTKFSKNSWHDFANPRRSGGAIYILVYYDDPDCSAKINFEIRNVSFDHNVAQYDGACMYVSTLPSSHRSSVYFIMESIVAHHNPDSNMIYNGAAGIILPPSLFYFSNIRELIINGSKSYPCNFSQNYGSVFVIIASTTVLQGYVLFHNNTADQGAALQLLENSQVYLKEGLRANFVNNKAKSLGGAIYATGELYTKGPCTFQLYSQKFKNIVMSFANNRAMIAGNAIYSQKIYDCFMNNTEENPTVIYKTIFKNLNEPTDISSYGDVVVVCGVQEYEAYPGKSLKLSIRIKDRNKEPTYGFITVSIAGRMDGGLQDIDWLFSNNQESYTCLIKATISCININFTLHTNDTSKFNKSGILIFSLLNPSRIFGFRLELKKCPTGFRLHPVKGSCVCLIQFAALVNQHSNGKEIICDIDSKSFSRPYPFLWVGEGENNSLHYSLNCPPGYCNIYSNHDMLIFNVTGSYVSSLHNDIKPLCHGSRTGDICGECIPNYSVVFGSTDCRVCSDKRWLLTAIIYIVAGPLLVFVLFKLNLTLTRGTLNGIIFYAQITNIQQYFNTPCSDCGNESYFIKFTSLFISWLNLNLGFPLCFYDGMNELWKAGLSLFFPVYLLLIVTFLAILSHFFTAVSNRLTKSSVQVLVTAVHLSFTQLLQAILDVFGSAQVFIENENNFYKRTVWYHDGAIVYASTKHQWLMIITSIIVGFILIPYMAIILFGKRLMKFDKFRKYIRPFFEAIHAPYKDNMWYWFALNQVFVVLVYVLGTINGWKYLSLSVFCEVILFQIFNISQSCFMPFKNKILNVLNIFLVLNLSIAYFTAMYYFHQYPKAVVMFVSFSVCPAIAIFCLILTFHILVVTNKLKNVLQLFKTVKNLRLRCLRRQQVGRRTNHNNFAAYCRDIQDSGDYSKAREPLLEYIST